MQADIDNEQLTISLLFPTNSLRTHLQKSAESSQKVSPPFSLKINAPFLITQMAEVALVSETFRHFRHMSFSRTTSETIKSRRRLNLRLGCQTKAPEIQSNGNGVSLFIS